MLSVLAALGGPHDPYHPRLGRHAHSCVDDDPGIGRHLSLGVHIEGRHPALYYLSDRNSTREDNFNVPAPHRW